MFVRTWSLGATVKKPGPTFHYTGWLIGILIMAYYNPYITQPTGFFFIDHLEFRMKSTDSQDGLFRKMTWGHFFETVKPAVVEVICGEGGYHFWSIKHWSDQFQISKLVPKEQLFNGCLVKHPFLCNDLESSNWNKQFLSGCFGHQESGHSWESVWLMIGTSCKKIQRP